MDTCPDGILEAPGRPSSSYTLLYRLCAEADMTKLYKSGIYTPSFPLFGKESKAENRTSIQFFFRPFLPLELSEAVRANAKIVNSLIAYDFLLI